MRDRWRVFLVVMMLLALVLQGLPVAGSANAHRPDVPPASEGRGPESDWVPGEILVRFERSVSSSTAQVAAGFGATRARTLYGSDVELWRVPVGQERSVAARLEARADVVYAEPNYIYSAFGTPDDPLFSRQWAHTIIHSVGAWNLQTGAATTVIAILDTGIDETHPDLAPKIVAGYDFVDNDMNPHDTNGHGTHVAGIAAAQTNNGTGIAGMDWGARIMPVRVLGETGSGTNEQITAGIIWATQHGADVLNLSLGGPSYSQAMQDAIDSTHAAGRLVIAAMGNERPTNPTSYPAALDHVFAVAATTSTNTYAPYSQYGAHTDIAAPGGYMEYYSDPRGIYSTMPTYACYLTSHEGFLKNYDYLRGTSQAAPLVAGLAALVWSEDPTLTADEVQGVIETTAVDLGAPGWDPTYGYGRIDALAALQAVSAPDPVTDLRITTAVTATGILTATFSWTPPTDAITVTVRSAAARITDATWGSTSVLTDALPASTSTYIAHVPYAGSTLYFALRSQDAAGLWSPLSNQVFWPFWLIHVPLVTRSR